MGNIEQSKQYKLSIFEKSLKFNRYHTGEEIPANDITDELKSKLSKIIVFNDPGHE